MSNANSLQIGNTYKQRANSDHPAIANAITKGITDDMTAQDILGATLPAGPVAHGTVRDILNGILNDID